MPLHIRGWWDRHRRSSPIVSCSNAAPPSRGYNVPPDRSRGFCRSRHSIHRHTCPLFPLDCWIPVLSRIWGLVVLVNLAGTSINCFVAFLLLHDLCMSFHTLVPLGWCPHKLDTSDVMVLRPGGEGQSLKAMLGKMLAFQFAPFPFQSANSHCLFWFQVALSGFWNKQIALMVANVFDSAIWPGVGVHIINTSGDPTYFVWIAFL